MRARGALIPLLFYTFSYGSTEIVGSPAWMDLWPAMAVFIFLSLGLSPLKSVLHLSQNVQIRKCGEKIQGAVELCVVFLGGAVLRTVGHLRNQE